MNKTKLMWRIGSGVCLLWVVTVQADNQLNLDASLAYQADNNLNRAAISSLKRDDTSTEADIGLNYSQKLDHYSILSYLANLRYVSFNEYDGLNHTEVHGRVQYKIKPDLSYGGITYIVDIDASLLDYETDIRDSNLVSLGLTLSRWITDRLSAATGIRARFRDSDSRVYDTRDYRLFVNADLAIASHQALYVTWNYIAGQTVSTIPFSVQNAEVLKVIDIANDWEPDSTFTDNGLAYVFDTRTQVFTLGYNYSIDRRQSLDLSAEIVSSRADGGVDYSSRIFSLNYLLRFRL